jgi:hypothetical protein
MKLIIKELMISLTPYLALSNAGMTVHKPPAIVPMVHKITRLNHTGIAAMNAGPNPAARAAPKRN